jgi:hypothetical protein
MKKLNYGNLMVSNSGAFKKTSNLRKKPRNKIIKRARTLKNPDSPLLKKNELFYN